MKNENETHSPGPWRVESNGCMRFYIVPECRNIPLAETTFNGLPLEVDRANARLIAAAPELLEALKLAQRFCEFTTLNKPAINPLATITAAIAKAEGVNV